MQIICNLKGCYTLFTSQHGNHKYCSPKCAKIAQAQGYKKWKRDHPEEYKAFQKIYYEKRKASRGGRKPESVRYRHTPQPKQHKCKRCGRLSNNVFNCPACLDILLRNCSQEHPDMVYDAGVPITDARSIKDGRRYDNT